MFNGIGTGQREVIKQTPRSDFQTLLFMLSALVIFVLLSCSLVVLLGWRGVLVVCTLILVWFGGKAGITGIDWLRRGLGLWKGLGMLTATLVCAITLLMIYLNLELLVTFWPVPRVTMEEYPAAPGWVYTAGGNVILENGVPFAGNVAVYDVNGHHLEVRTGTLWVDDVPVYEFVLDAEEGDVIPHIDGEPVTFLGLPLVLGEQFIITWNRFRGSAIILSACVIGGILLAFPGIGAFLASSIREMFDKNTPATRQPAPWHVSPVFYIQAIFDKKKRGQLWSVAMAALQPQAATVKTETKTEIRIVDGRGAVDADGIAQGAATFINYLVPEDIAPSLLLERLAEEMNNGKGVSRATGRHAGWSDDGWRDFCEWSLAVAPAIMMKPNSNAYKFTVVGEKFMEAFGFERKPTLPQP